MTLRAGAAQQDISPDKPVALFGYPHVKRVSTGVHDPLLASALYLENEEARLVIVALDLLFLDPPVVREIRGDVAKVLGVSEDVVFISCTHTHSGPVTGSLLAWQKDSAVSPPDPAYLLRVRAQVVRACRAAAALACPAELAWTTADATGVGGNRISPAGVIDPECGILSVRDSRSKKFISIALIYGMHPTVLHEDSTLVSSDFPHYTRSYLGKSFGKDLVVLYHNAPCGNQSPRFFVKVNTFAEAERLGRKLGRVAAVSIRALRKKNWCDDPLLAGKRVSVNLPRRRSRSLRKARQILDDSRRAYEFLKMNKAARPKVRTAECAVFGAEGMVTLAEANVGGKLALILKKYQPIEVQALRIGDTCVAGLPGECFTEYALAIKRNAGIGTFAVSLVNGELQGYITTPEADKAGGYEAANAVFSPQAGVVMVNAALGIIGQLME